jgi:pimeloyl-ACP methyl ester carboxylesterase
MPSNFSEDQLTADMLVRVLSEAVSRLVGQKPALIVGYSTGGYAALHLAARAPGVVKAVCSISGFVQGRWRGALGNNQRIASLPLIGIPMYIFGYRLAGLTSWIWAQSWRIYMGDARALFAHPRFKKAVNGGYAHFRALDFRIMAYYFRRFRRIDISAVLPQIRIPVLLITGDKDPIVPSSQSRLIAEKVASSELVVLKGTGHVPMLERADELNRALLNWLEKYV